MLEKAPNLYLKRTNLNLRSIAIRIGEKTDYLHEYKSDYWRIFRKDTQNIHNLSQLGMSPMKGNRGLITQ